MGHVGHSNKPPLINTDATKTNNLANLGGDDTNSGIQDLVACVATGSPDVSLFGCGLLCPLA